MPRAASSAPWSVNLVPETGRNAVDGVEEEEKDALEVPCFEEAHTVSLDLGFLLISMPSGVFNQLAILILERVRFCNPSELGDVVSTPRCPRLQVLMVRHASGLLRLAINSESLLQLELVELGALRELAIEAAALKKLVVSSCFRYMSRVLPVATISAPRLVILKLGDAYVQRYVQLSRMPHLQSIGDLSYCVYGVQRPNGGSEHNKVCLKLLQPIKTIKTLSLSLAYFMVS